jgi:hypothetical protein
MIFRCLAIIFVAECDVPLGLGQVFALHRLVVDVEAYYAGEDEAMDRRSPTLGSVRK